jgi:hypothetical protein
VLQRSEFQKYIEKNAKRVAENPAAYKQRQAIVEHPYGTIKRQWGFDHITTKKTKRRAKADVGFIFIAYNLTRIWNSIKQQQQISYKIRQIKVSVEAILMHIKQLKIEITKPQMTYVL